MLTAQFMTRKLTKEFIKKNGRTPTKDEFITIQHEAVTTLIKTILSMEYVGKEELKLWKILPGGVPYIYPTEKRQDMIDKITTVKKVMVMDRA